MLGLKDYNLKFEERINQIAQEELTLGKGY